MGLPGYGQQWYTEASVNLMQIHIESDDPELRSNLHQPQIFWARHRS
jgi:hypothetical protein